MARTYSVPNVAPSDFDMADRVVSVLSIAEHPSSQWHKVRWTFTWGSEWHVSADVWSVRGWLPVWDMPAHGAVLSGSHSTRADQITAMLVKLEPHVNRVLAA